MSSATSPKVEVLRLSIERMEQGLIYRREMAFTSDHQVIARLSRREDDTECPWESKGWHRMGDWRDMTKLQKIAYLKALNGWQAEWNPQYQPGLREFTKYEALS